MSTPPIPPPGRRGRLSRAAEFDAVSQLGRSVGGRYLVLRYRRRDDDGGPRVGWAVPRKVGAGRRPKHRQAAAARGRCPRRTTCCARPPTTSLIARPGIGPAAEAQGFDWLCGQVEELLRAVEPEPVA